MESSREPLPLVPPDLERSSTSSESDLYTWSSVGTVVDPFGGFLGTGPRGIDSEPRNRDCRPGGAVDAADVDLSDTYHVQYEEQRGAVPLQPPSEEIFILAASLHTGAQPAADGTSRRRIEQEIANPGCDRQVRRIQ
jgi:hypothetical protein